MLLDIIAHRVDAALEAKRQPVARRVDILDNPRELIRGEADHVEDRTEILTIQLVYRLNLIKRGSNEAAVRRRVRQRQAADARGVLVEPLEVILECLLGGFVDRRPHIGRNFARIADF